VSLFALLRGCLPMGNVDIVPRLVDRRSSEVIWAFVRDARAWSLLSEPFAPSIVSVSS